MDHARVVRCFDGFGDLARDLERSCRREWPLLGKSKFTIRNQISSILDKTRLASRAELAAWIGRHEAAR